MRRPPSSFPPQQCLRSGLPTRNPREVLARLVPLLDSEWEIHCAGAQKVAAKCQTQNASGRLRRVDLTAY